MDTAFDVAIVGAGIAGASLGWRLAGDGALRVIVLEREAQPGYHSTGRSAAMFMETYGTPTIRALTRASRGFYEQPPAGFASHPVLAPRGALYVAREGQGEMLDAAFAELVSAAPDVRRLTAAEARARVPVLRAEGLLGAVIEGDARDIDVHALHQGYLAGLRRQGGIVRADAEVRAATRQGGAWTLELADGTTLRARFVVDAAGAWADALAAICGARPVGLEPRRRSAFIFTPPEGIDCRTWPAVAGIDETWYFKPDAGLLLGSPANADAVPPHDVVPEELDIALGIDRIQQATTMHIARPRRTWAGLRSFVRDGELVVGWDDRCEGFFWLAAQGGYGIQTAAGVAELAAALLQGRPVPDALLRQGVDPAVVNPARLR